MDKHIKTGFIAALSAIIIWSSTYISTKLLVQSFSALQISFVRFSIGLGVLLLLAPPRRNRICLKDEVLFAQTGITGMFLYYFLENLATKYTYASNVSVIVTSIPLITSVLGAVFYRDEKFSMKYAVSFILSTVGFLAILSQSGAIQGVSAKGDVLALCASFVFASYTLLLRKISRVYSSLVITRKSVFYGWIVITAVTVASGQVPDAGEVFQLPLFGHFLFLGVLASGFCFIFWSYAVKSIGAVRASQFIYLVPIFTITLSFILLGERYNGIQCLGVICILGAVVISQRSWALPEKPGIRDGVS